VVNDQITIESEKDLHFTLLIPAYNEEERIAATLKEYAEYFRQHFSGSIKILVILNGCRDATLEVVHTWAKQYTEVEAMEFKAPIGKGGALIEGLKLAPDTDIIGYTDADGATPPDAMLFLLRKCYEYDGVIGSRWLPDSKLHQAQTLTRRFASRVFHRIVHWLFRLGFKDTQCPAKIFKKASIVKIHDGLMIADLAFDVNLLYLLKREGFKVIEIGTEWTDKLGSKVTQTLFRSSLTMLLSIIRLRLVYSPLRRLMPIFRPLEAWIYKKLRAPFIPLNHK
jgi:glycosyltransferase involved in cell wall biosynthesis